MSNEILNSPCKECVGACCRGGAISMPLYKHEVKNLELAGTALREILPASDEAEWHKRSYFRKHAEIEDKNKRKIYQKVAKSIDQGQGLYTLVSDCGFLEETPDGRAICSVHEDPELKPEICDKFTPGEPACEIIKDKALMRLENNSQPIAPEIAQPNLDLAQVAMSDTVLQTIDSSFRPLTTY